MAILGNSNKNRYDSSSMEDLENLLFSSKQVKSNSEDMEAVYRALIAVNAFHNKTIDVKDYASVNKAQANLVAACDNYLQVKGNKLHRTVGKDRLDIVRAISNLAKQEDFRDIDYKRFEGKTWGELRGEQRTLTKTLSDDTKLVTAGANSSSRNIFDEGYFTHSINRHRYGSHELFRDEVYNNMFRKDQELITPYMDEIFDEYLKTSHTSDAVLLATKDLKKRLESIPSFANLPSEKQDLIFSKGIEFQKAIANLGNVGPGNSALIPDDDVDLSLHNVATSRLAEMCGAPDIVAKSQKMIVSENGIEHHGVVMANAVGMDYSKMNKEEKTVFSQADTSDPEFQRQANRLMILDMIAGQTDRNIGNAF